MHAMHLFRKSVSSSSLLPDGRVLRAIQAPNHVKNSEGVYVVSSAAFSPSSSDKCLSVDIEQIMKRDGLNPTDLYPSMPRSVGLYAVGVDKLGELKLGLEHQPLRSNWYHGGVLHISHGLRKKLAKAASAVIEIDQTAAAEFYGEKSAIEV